MLAAGVSDSSEGRELLVTVQQLEELADEAPGKLAPGQPDVWSATGAKGTGTASKHARAAQGAAAAAWQALRSVPAAAARLPGQAAAGVQSVVGGAFGWLRPMGRQLDQQMSHAATIVGEHAEAAAHDATALLRHAASAAASAAQHGARDAAAAASSAAAGAGSATMGAGRAAAHVAGKAAGEAAQGASSAQHAAQATAAKAVHGAGVAVDKAAHGAEAAAGKLVQGAEAAAAQLAHGAEAVTSQAVHGAEAAATKLAHGVESVAAHLQLQNAGQALKAVLNQTSRGVATTTSAIAWAVSAPLRAVASPLGSVAKLAPHMHAMRRPPAARMAGIEEVEAKALALLRRAEEAMASLEQLAGKPLRPLAVHHAPPMHAAGQGVAPAPASERAVGARAADEAVQKLLRSDAAYQAAVARIAEANEWVNMMAEQLGVPDVEFAAGEFHRMFPTGMRKVRVEAGGLGLGSGEWATCRAVGQRWQAACSLMLRAATNTPLLTHLCWLSGAPCRGGSQPMAQDGGAGALPSRWVIRAHGALWQTQGFDCWCPAARPAFLLLMLLPMKSMITYASLFKPN